MISAWFGQIFAYWQTRRMRLFTGTALLALLMGELAFRAPLQEDIGAMLPDDPPAIRDTFQSLSHAPFLQMILVDLHLKESGKRDALHASVDALAGAMQIPYFSKVVTGVDDMEARKLLQWLLAHFPQLFTEEDAAAVKTLLESQPVRERLQANLNLLAQPEGMVMKGLVIEDPLALRELLLRKLRYLSVVPQTRLEQGHFVSTDGQHALLIAQTPVEFSNVARSTELLTHLQSLLKTHLAEGVEARVVCGHRYTVANAEIIRNDLGRVFTASTAGLVLAFVLFMRHRSAVLAFLLPFFATVFGLGITSLVFPAVSGITVGFGAVLLGVTVDLGVYVYFALRDGSADPKTSIVALTPALILCALTSILTFALLLLSSLPVQRQLAVFSVAGLVAAFFFALIVLPHVVPAGSQRFRSWLLLHWQPRGLALLWGVLVVAAAPFALHAGFDGNLRNVGYIPQDAVADELAIRETWGEVRDRAMAISESGTMNDALQQNDALLAAVKTRFPDANVVSVGAFLPGQQTQARNLARWNEFWNVQGRAAAAKQLLEEIGNELGFSAGTFDTFFTWIQIPREPFEGASLQDAGLAQWMGPLIGQTGGKSQIVTFLEDTPRMAEFFGTAKPPVEGVRYVSDLHFNTLMNEVMSREFTLFMILAAVSVLVLLTLLFRDWRRVLLCLVPAISGVVFMFAALPLTAQKLNLFNMLGAVLLIGLATDYGIVMLYRIEGRLTGAGERVVLVSGLTTLFGFGALTLARHPAMFSIGSTMTLGLIPAILGAMIFMPACALALGFDVKRDSPL